MFEEYVERTSKPVEELHDQVIDIDRDDSDIDPDIESDPFSTESASIASEIHAFKSTTKAEWYACKYFDTTVEKISNT